MRSKEQIRGFMEPIWEERLMVLVHLLGGLFGGKGVSLLGSAGMLGIGKNYRSKSAHFWVGEGLGICPVIIMIESRHRNWQGGSVIVFLVGGWEFGAAGLWPFDGALGAPSTELRTNGLGVSLARERSIDGV